MVWRVFAVGMFLLFAIPLLVVKVRTTRRERYKLLAQSGDPVIVAEAIRRDIISPYRYLFFTSLPWVEIKNSTAIIQFDTSPPAAEDDSYEAKLAYQRYNRNLFRKSCLLLASALGTNIPLGLVSAVIVSAYETRQDKMEDTYKLCVLSFRAEREIVTPSFSKAKEKEPEFSFDIRFDPNKDFILREVVPFERSFEQEDVVVQAAEKAVRTLEEIQALSLPGLRRLVKKLLSDMDYAVSEIPIVGREEKEYIRGNLVERVFFNMGHVKGKGLSVRREVDMIAKKDGEKVGVGCIISSSPVEQKAVEDFYRVLEQRGIERGYFVTNNMFSLQAIAWAENKLIELIDGKKLKDLLDSLKMEEKVVEKSGEETEEAFPPTSPVVHVRPDFDRLSQAASKFTGEQEFRDEDRDGAGPDETQQAAEAQETEKEEITEEGKVKEEKPKDEKGEEAEGGRFEEAASYDQVYRRVRAKEEVGKEAAEGREVKEVEQRQLIEKEQELYLMTVKCQKCGWTFEQNLGRCPNCGGVTPTRTVIEKRYLGDEGKTNQNLG